ncbi:MAG TPA: glycosyltransferase family 2 protein [Candidatus Binatia bacterium]|nr:glycosyltransferase family 2 protein [Candidatus Binatia bacterium]
MAILQKEGMHGLRWRLYKRFQRAEEYWRWSKAFDTLTDRDRVAIKQHIGRLHYTPLISVIMPVYNTPEAWLRRAIESIRSQLYPNWELCIADDASSKPHVKSILQEYEAKDARIKVTFRDVNGHISAASNSAIEMARGDFIALVDHDDELREHALYIVVTELNAHPELDLIYSDEDKIDEKGRRYDPYFKPDWNPALFLGQNFVSHLSVYRTRIVREIGGFRAGYEGAQDWDLATRVIEAIPPSHIRHIPHVLYHWRAIRGSAALAMDEKNYVNEAQRKTLQSHFDRIGQEVEILPAAEHYWRIRYPIAEPLPMVTLIIPTRNGHVLLRRCVESIYQKTTYRNFELIIVDNQSDDPDTLNYLVQLEKKEEIRILRYDAHFNYSAINNFAVKHARGEIVGLLNNDLEVITPDWLDEMVSHAFRPEIGAVGAMLYYPNDTIQHAGVILGVRGVAAHAYCRQPRGYNGIASRAALCQNLSAVTAACLVVRREVFEKVGGLDEIHLAVAFNDIDFCLRVREKGYRNIWTPYAEFYHDESASRGYEESPEKLDRFEKERDHMKRRWGELLLNDPAYNPNLALDRETFTLAFPPRVTKPWLIEHSG